MAEKKKYAYFFGAGQTEGNAGMRDLLGGKGANLAEMASLGLPVPQGFTISTEACTRYYDDGKVIGEDIQAQVLEYIDKLEMLVNHADLILECISWRTDHDFFAVHENLPVVGVIDAGDHVHQRGFAAAVFTENGEDLSVIYRQAHIVIGDYISECFCQMCQSDRGYVAFGADRFTHLFKFFLVPFLKAFETVRKFADFIAEIFYFNSFVKITCRNFPRSRSDLAQRF